MRRNATHSMGAIHPVLFFMLVYGISLFMAFFVCRTVYYSLNNEASPGATHYASATANITAMK